MVATAAVLHTTATAVPSDRRGEAVVPALRTRAGDLTGITIRDSADTFNIERRGGEFVAADSGFPVRLDALREVVTQSAGLTFNDARTADPSRYSELGLADSGEGSGKEIVFHATNGDIADIVVGNNDSTAGTAGGGQFVRIKGQPQTWLARGSVRVPTNRTGWYANVDFDTKRTEIKKVTLSGGGGDTITIAADAQKPGEFDLENVPEKREPDSFKVSRLATLFDAFSFQDVRKRTAPAPADARHIAADSDGVEVTLTSVGNLADGWVQITAEPTATDGKPDKAKAIATKTADFEFRLPSQQTEILGWNLKDVTNEKPQEQPQPAGLPPGVPGTSPMRIPGTGIPRLAPGVAPKPEAPGGDPSKPEAANTKSDTPAEAAPAAPAKEEPKDAGKPSESPAPPAETKP
ncbi:MAG: DUF4340 domain-containing protein [Xanthobacteraceae bacterium]|nr:DUF4340 domain-containing protein [Xanthobacteraceae bacterium]